MKTIYIIEIYDIKSPYVFSLAGVFDRIFDSYESAEKRLLQIPGIEKDMTVTFNRYVSSTRMYSIKEIKYGGH